jgi:hypothetical protein
VISFSGSSDTNHDSLGGGGGGGKSKNKNRAGEIERKKICAPKKFEKNICAETFQ